MERKGRGERRGKGREERRGGRKGGDMSNRSVITNSTGIGADSSSAALLPGIVGGAVSLLVAGCFLYLYYRFCCAAASVAKAVVSNNPHLMTATMRMARNRVLDVIIPGMGVLADAMSLQDAYEVYETCKEAKEAFESAEELKRAYEEDRRGKQGRT